MAHWRDPEARQGRWDGYRLEISGLQCFTTQLVVAGFFLGGPTPSKIRMLRQGAMHASTTISSLVSFERQEDQLQGHQMVLAWGYKCRCLVPA